MKCAYCKEEVNADDNSYEVEINGVECTVHLHYACLRRVIGEFFSRPPMIYKVTQEDADRMILKGDDRWIPKWTSGGTTDCPPPDSTRVWCKADDESTHSPWKDRVD